MDFENLKPKEMHHIVSVLFIYFLYLGIRAGIKEELFPTRGWRIIHNDEESFASDFDF